MLNQSVKAQQLKFSLHIQEGRLTSITPASEFENMRSKRFFLLLFYFKDSHDVLFYTNVVFAWLIQFNIDTGFFAPPPKYLRKLALL